MVLDSWKLLELDFWRLKPLELDFWKLKLSELDFWNAKLLELDFWNARLLELDFWNVKVLDLDFSIESLAVCSYSPSCTPNFDRYYLHTFRSTQCCRS
jgi:hypothetical protein